MTLLTIDLRKAYDTGIGTYIQQVVPRVCHRLDGFHLRGIVQRGTTSHAYLGSLAIDLVEMDARPFTAAEQWCLRRTVAGADLFWATSLAHPLWPSVPLAMTVYDLAQLTLPSRVGGGWRRRTLALPYFHSAHRRAAALLFTTSHVERQYHSILGSPTCAVATVPLGVDDAWFAAAVPDVTDPPYFIVVGNLRPHKNFALVIRAFDRVRDVLPTHRLRVTGPDAHWTPRDPEDAKAFARMRSRVDFTGPLPTSELRAAVARADALVFASLHEGFGLPVLEAMAAGCAVAAARNGVSEEIGGEAATLFDPRSVDELAAVMVEISSRTLAERTRRRHAGVKRARQFSWETTAARTADLLRHAL